MQTEQEVTRFRIYTEDITPTDSRLSAMGITPEVLVALEFGFGVTTYRTKGDWEGGSEDSLVFEILAHEDTRRIVFRVAEDIRKRCGQKAVIVTTERVHQHTFTGD